MSLVDVSSLSLEELEALQKEAAKAVKNFEQRQFNEARAELEAVARKHGFKLADFMGGKAPKGGSINPAKYRNPNNPSQTWTGRGRQPNWVKDLLAAGKSLEDFAI